MSRWIRAVDRLNSKPLKRIYLMAFLPSVILNLSVKIYSDIGNNSSSRNNDNKKQVSLLCQKN